MTATDKIVEDLEDTAQWHNNKKWYWHVKKLKVKSLSGLAPVKDRNGATTSNKERIKEKWVKHFENVLNHDIVIGKDVEKVEEVWDTLDVKEESFSEQELVTVLKGLKNTRLYVVIIW